MVKKKQLSKLRLNDSQFISGLAISSMVFGIIAVLFFWVVFIGLILGLLAFILGVSTLKRGVNRNISFVGVVTGLVAVIMNLAMIYFFINGMISYSVVTRSANSMVTQN